MRIAHVTDCFLPRVGGIERQVDGLSRRQAARGDDVEVITTVAGPPVAQMAGLPRLVRPLSADPASTRIRHLAARPLARSIDLSTYDVMHIHASTISPLAFALIRRAVDAGTPTVLTVHSMWTGAVRPGLLVIDAATGWTGWPFVRTAVSAAAARHVGNALGGDVTVLPNGVDAQFWQAAQVPPTPGQLRIVSVMRLAGRKRPMPFIAMLRSLRRQLPQQISISARIIGDGPQRHAVRDRLRAWGMASWVRLDGQLASTEICAAFADADVYVAPAEQEAFGIAALEAHTAGLPVVAFAQSGVADIVEHGLDGLLVPDDGSMVTALIRLALDADALAALRRSASGRLPAFDWTSVLARCDAVYDAATLTANTRALVVPPTARPPIKVS